MSRYSKTVDIVERLERWKRGDGGFDTPDIEDAIAEIRSLRSEASELRGALKDVASSCRGSGPWARDHDDRTLYTIGKMVEHVLSRSTAVLSKE